jgi:hypothetical protein
LIKYKFPAASICGATQKSNPVAVPEIVFTTGADDPIPPNSVNAHVEAVAAPELFTVVLSTAE